MFFKATTSLIFLTSMAGCIGDTASTDTDAGIDSIDSAIAVCDCPEKTAAEITFDNTASELTSETVQDAIDEVSTSIPSIPEAITARIKIETVTDNNITQSTAAVSVVCGGSEGDWLAIGGGCTTGSSSLTLYSSGFEGGAMDCRWRNPNVVAVSATATVTCLDLRPE